MNYRSYFLRIFLFLLLFIFLSSHAQSSHKAVLLQIQGGIGPATADYIDRGIQFASSQQASFIILRLDTPGGLDKSMRSIIESMLSSEIPIIAYVAPSGARAASAGTFILYASHIAAMAPGTNIGAASPVSIGGSVSSQDTLTHKITNDAIAFIRSLAQLRGRNIQFAEQAVRNAATMTAEEALKNHVIEIVAIDIPDLMKQLNHRTVTLHGKNSVLDTNHLTIFSFNPDWRTAFLSVITDPSVAYILLLIGIYGLIFEFSNPGFVMPGVSGAISLLLALYAFQLLPINYAGLALIFLGIVAMIMEAFVPFGALGVGGVISFIIGSILLFDPRLSGYQIAWPLIFAMAIISAGFFMFVIGLAYKARRKQVVSGKEELIGMTGVVLEDMKSPFGQALIHGEIWKIESKELLKRDTVVRVFGMKGLILQVEAVRENTRRIP